MIPFETTLRAIADKRLASLDVTKYKRVVLGLILLKYTSDGSKEKPPRSRRRALIPGPLAEYLTDGVGKRLCDDIRWKFGSSSAWEGKLFVGASFVQLCRADVCGRIRPGELQHVLQPIEMCCCI
jgi:hypothetical protein